MTARRLSALLLGLTLATGCVGEVGEPLGTYVPDDYQVQNAQRVIFLGDSLTQGIGASSVALTYRSLLMNNADQVWPNAANKDLTSSFPGLNQVFDHSLSGATSDDLIQDQVPALSAELPAVVSGETIVVLTIGGNDLYAGVQQGLDAQGIANMVGDNLETLVQFFDNPTRFPDGVFIYYGSVFDPTDGHASADQCFPSELIPLLRPAAYAVAERVQRRAIELEIAHVDLLGPFLGHGFGYSDDTLPTYDAADPTFWLSDCFHPNDRGYHEMRKQFWRAISGLSGDDFEG